MENSKLEKQIENMAEEILQEYTNCYSEVDQECLEKMLRKLASDLAEEIISCIHDEIELALESNYKARKERIIDVEMATDDAFTEYINGKIATLRGIDDFLAELKKKYIGKDTNATTNTEEGK